MTRFELDPGARRLSHGRVLLGGSPLSMFRLTDAGSRIVERIADGVDLAAGHEALTDRLVATGAIHPVPTGADGPTAAEVTLVVPAYGADPTRVALIASATGAGRTIVVDDASTSAFPGRPGLEVIRRGANGGPGAARQTGLDAVTTPFVAFVDADVSPPAGWLGGLLVHFGPTVGLVAPRVRAGGGSSLLARFEELRSPLDLGPTRGRIRAGTRVSYVPAAALVCRTEALRAVGGFAAELRLGEDVDLVWRLDEAGWACRYEPAVTVTHDVRDGLSAWVRQRVGYGFSATDLAERHPGAVAPVNVSAWSALAWGLPAAGAPIGGMAVGLASGVALASAFPEMPGRTEEAMRLAGLGHLRAGRILAAAVTRSWWPVALVLAMVSRRARRVLVVAAVVPSLAEWWKVRQGLDPVRYTALRLLDDAAYGAGVWKGAIARRSMAALRPTLTGWPHPRRPEPRRPDHRRGSQGNR